MDLPINKFQGKSIQNADIINSVQIASDYSLCFEFNII